MLARAQRLRKTADINRVYQSGRKAYHPFLRCLVLPSVEASSRLAIVVSQRVAKQAVLRNRIRRQLRSIIQKQLSRISQPYDIVIIVQPAATKATYEDLEKAINAVFYKHKLYVVQ